MKRFLRHLLIFLAPLIAIAAAGEAVLFGTGELWPVASVLDYQRTHPESLYLRGIDQSFYAYKYRAILARRPSILVLGSSRTMKFRAPMFGDRQAEMFNAGGLVNSVDDLADTSAALESSRVPNVILIGVDIWWLNGDWQPDRGFASEIAKGTWWNVDEHLVAGRWLLRNPAIFARTALSFPHVGESGRIGIAARERPRGFRPDGSYKTDIEPPAPGQEWTFVDREVPPIIERARLAVANFPPAARMDSNRLRTLDGVLRALRSNNVLVLGYLPPFSTEVAGILSTDPRHAGIYTDFRRRVPDLFRQYGFPVIDASETAALGMTDRAMSDGLHPEETFQLHVLVALLEDSRVRAQLPGASEAVTRALASPATNDWQADLTDARRRD